MLGLKARVDALETLKISVCWGFLIAGEVTVWMFPSDSTPSGDGIPQSTVPVSDETQTKHHNLAQHRF